MTDDLTPPPPPPPPASAFPSYIAELPPATVHKRGLGTRSLAAVLGVVLVGGGLSFAVSQSAAGGASTPEEAVQQLFDAISDEDVVGVLDVLPEGERRSLQQPLEDLSAELQRLGVLSEDFDLSGVEGIDLEFDDLDLGSEPLAAGMSVVHLRGGSLTTAIDPDNLPIGDELRSLMEELNGEPLVIEPSSNSDDLNAAGDSIDIVTVEEDGTWRVSLYYSIAEAARAGTDLPLPDFGAGIAPNGQASPEAAVEALLRSGVEDLDIAAMIALLPPDEMAALQDYAPLFIDDAAADIADFRSRYTGSIDGVQLSADRNGDEALVTIDDIDIQLAYEDEDQSATFDGSCMRWSYQNEGDEEEQCLDDLPIGSAGPGQMDVPRRDNPPPIGILAVEVDGLWYVSPTRTILGAMAAGLGAFDDDALASIPDMLDGFLGGMFGGFGCETFSETGSAIDETGSAIDATGSGMDEVAGDIGVGAPSDCSMSSGRVEDSFDLPGVDGPALDEGITSTTISSGSSSPSTTTASGIPEEVTALEPTIEGLADMLMGVQGFTTEEADCIAQGVYAHGFTTDELLAIQNGQMPADVIDDVSTIVAECYSGAAGDPAG